MVEDGTELGFILGAAPVGVVLMDNSLYINTVLLVLLLNFAFWSLFTTVTARSCPKCPFLPLIGPVLSVHLCPLGGSKENKESQNIQHLCLFSY